MKELTITEVKKLEPSERLLIVEELWDSIAEDQKAFPITEAQKQELETRYQDFVDNPNEGSNWKQVLGRIQGLNG